MLPFFHCPALRGRGIALRAGLPSLASLVASLLSIAGHAARGEVGRRVVAAESERDAVIDGPVLGSQLDPAQVAGPCFEQSTNDGLRDRSVCTLSRQPPVVAWVRLHGDLGVSESVHDRALALSLGERWVVPVSRAIPRRASIRVLKPWLALSVRGLPLSSSGLPFRLPLGRPFLLDLHRLRALGTAEAALVLPTAYARLLRVFRPPRAVAALPAPFLPGSLAARDAELAQRPFPRALAMALTTSRSISSRNHLRASFLAVSTNRRRGLIRLPRVKM